MKYFNFKRYKFSTILKDINLRRYNFFKLINPAGLDYKKIYKYINTRTFDVTKLTKNLDNKIFNLGDIFSRIKIKKIVKSKFWFIHLPASIIFFVFLYLSIPMLYNYDQLTIENKLCKNKNVQCVIKGKIKYIFYPSPRLKINNILVTGNSKQEKPIISIEKVIVKLSIKNLLTKDKHKFKKIFLKNYTFNFNLNDFEKYKSSFIKEFKLYPSTFSKGKIIFYEGNVYVGTLDNANIDLTVNPSYLKTNFVGEFLNEKILISLTNKKIEEKSLIEISLKIPNLNLTTTAKLSKIENDKNIFTGNIVAKKDKYKFSGLLDYKDGKINISKSNLRNAFLDGKLTGSLEFVPFFNFNLDLSLNSMNFTKLYNAFLNLEEENQKNLFKISKKINGKLSFSSDKIYSSYNLTRSFESRVKFNNGNILIEQFLINLGKLGAADIVGTINNDKKFTNFKFESNIFVDNKKKFLSKFGIYKKKFLPDNLFVFGNFDLKNIRASFYEISDNEKLKDGDVNFIEDEFNEIMLTDGYKNLFNFQKFKSFIKSTTTEIN